MTDDKTYTTITTIASLTVVKVVEAMEIVGREEVPKKPGSGIKELFRWFSKITPKNALKFTASEIGLSVSGIKNAIIQWNKKKNQKLEWTFRTLKDGDVLVYVYAKEGENSGK